MHKLLVVLLALAFLPVAAGQQTYTLTGTVVDQNGAAVAGVAVYLYQYGEEPRPADGSNETKIAPSSYHEAQATTDAQGRFSLQARSGQANLNFYKDGYAGAYQSVDVRGSQNLDVVLEKYPDKTAHIEGRILAGGKPLPYVSLSIENPRYGLYACSMVEEDRQATATGSGTSGSSGGSTATSASSEPASDPAASSIAAPYPYYQDCPITVRADGSFSGDVWPGYSILRAYHDQWRQCPDGGCQEYYSHVEVRVLADGPNVFDIRLKARPAPDAVVLGHVLTQDGKAIQDVYVSFNNQDTYSWGQAQTDKDGSYKAALRSGQVEVSVWTEGYFPYYTTVEVKPGDNRLTIRLTEGESRYGGCCYYAMEGATVKSADGGPAPANTLAGPAAPGAMQAGDAAGSGNADDQASGVRDLGGGLGPYDPDAESSSDSPGLGLVLLVAALGAALVLRRRM